MVRYDNFDRLSEQNKTKAVFVLFMAFWGILFVAFPMIFGGIGVSDFQRFSISELVGQHSQGSQDVPMVIGSSMVGGGAGEEISGDSSSSGLLGESALVAPSHESALLEGGIISNEGKNKSGNGTQSGPMGLQCSVRLPVKPSFIIRLDDVRAYAWKDSVKRITGDVLMRGMSIVLGVIPETGFQGEGEMKQYLSSKSKEPGVEIALHGLTHSFEEFGNVEGEEALSMALEGRERIWAATGVYPTTFIPPYNAYDNEKLNAISRAGIFVVSGRQHEFKFDGSLFYAGFSDATRRYGAVDGSGVAHPLPLTPANVLMANCEQAMDSTNLCVILVHPQDFVGDDNIAVDEEKYLEFTGLLDSLGKSSARSMLFRDLLSCEDGSSQGQAGGSLQEFSGQCNEIGLVDGGSYEVAPCAGLGSDASGFQPYGNPLLDEKEKNRARTEEMLSYYFRTGAFPSGSMAFAL